MIAFTHTAADRIVLPCLDPGVKAGPVAGPGAVVQTIRRAAAEQLVSLPTVSLLEGATPTSGGRGGISVAARLDVKTRTCSDSCEPQFHMNS